MNRKCLCLCRPTTLLLSMGGIAALPIVAAGQSSNGAFFQPLGDLPGGDYFSRAIGVSSDGMVIVGASISAMGTEAFRWGGGVMVGLGDLPGQGFFSEAYTVSSDGSVVAGRAWSDLAGPPQSYVPREAFRWEENIMTPIGDLPGAPYLSEAFAMTPDGSVIVGRAFSGSNNEAFRWESDVMVGLGGLSGNSVDSFAFGVSEDGATIVGYSYSESGQEACEWVNGAIHGLGDLPGGVFASHAYDISLDGETIVGYANSSNGIEACRWTELGLEGLGDLAGGSFESHARAVSGDGRKIVGYGTSESGPRAMIWTAAHGMRQISDVLNSSGISNLDGWTLTIAYDISDDGKTIVGEGLNPIGQTEAWAAQLGDCELRLHGDVAPCSGDGIVNLDDILAVLNAFSGANACPAACVIP